MRTGYVGFELHGEKAVRKGEWKLLWNTPEGIWELFDLSVDVGETTDVSADHPEVLVEMLGYWEEYERTNKIPPLQRPQV